MPDHAADTFGAPDDAFDFADVGRLVAWGAAAFVALAGALMVARSEQGLRRISNALDSVTSATRFANAPLATETSARTAAAEAQTARLVETVRSLASDRDRLLSRLSALEHTIEVTSAIPAAPSGAPERAVSRTPDGVEAGGEARAAAVSRASPKPSVPAELLFSPPVAEPREQSRVPAKPARPTAPWTIQNVSGAETAAESALSRTEFGIDLGVESNIEALRGLWMTVRAQHAALLDGLRPIVAIRESAQGGVDLRLVAGPVVNAAAAARLCAVLMATGRACQAVPFEGQRLALR
jgi:hypothetical protein